MSTVQPLLFPNARMLRIALCAALFAVAGIMQTGPARGADDTIRSTDAAEPLPRSFQSFDFSIAPQPLTTALEIYGRTTDIQIFYSSRFTNGRISPGAQGTYTAEAALNRLLAGTDLVPIRTTHNVITLTLAFHDLKFATASTVPAPVLALDVMHVNAPEPVGHLLYASTVRHIIQDALQRNHTVRKANYHININVWISPLGYINRIEQLAPTGSARIDAGISNVIQNISIGSPPPSDLPQPIHVNILAVGAR